MSIGSGFPQTTLVAMTRSGLLDLVIHSLKDSGAGLDVGQTGLLIRDIVVLGA